MLSRVLCATDADPVPTAQRWSHDQQQGQHGGKAPRQQQGRLWCQRYAARGADGSILAGQPQRAQPGAVRLGQALAARLAWARAEK